MPSGVARLLCGGRDGEASRYLGGRPAREGGSVMRDSLTPFLRRKAADPSAPGRELTEPERRSLPGGFDAVAEALASGRSPVAACAVAGRALAWDGVSLGEALSGLRDTCAAVGGAAPDVAAVESLAEAWSEATLEVLHDVSCEDPLTGLASLPHLRTRLAELYREAEATGHSVRVTYALVVVDIGGGERGRWGCGPVSLLRGWSPTAGGTAVLMPLPMPSPAPCGSPQWPTACGRCSPEGGPSHAPPGGGGPASFPAPPRPAGA